MRLIRSCFFGGLAMLAAVMFISMPSYAGSLEPGYHSVLAYAFSLDLPDAAQPAAIVAEREAVPKAGADAHAVVYVSQNQPLTSWRFAVDAYSRIDPHISIG